MTSSVFDQPLQQHMWSTDEMRAVFSEENRVQKWFDFEAALALEQAALDIIPSAAAGEIAARANVADIDMAALARETRRVKHPLVPAVRALQRQCAGALGEFVHFGPTSQDVYDTGMMLQVREAHSILMRDLTAASRELYRLADAHKHTPMAGRTHSVQALPITFGHKCAVWLSELGRHHERMQALEARTFVGQMVGAVGTKASFGPHAMALEARLMARLGLNVADISWQPARDRLGEYVSVLGLIGATLGKIANAIMNLEADEVGELAEPFNEGKVGSSTMPHKRNPAVVETVVTLSRAIRYSVAMMHDAQMAEHERDVAAVRMEWKAVERVMFALSEKVGKQTAHELVYAAAMQGMEGGITFEQALQRNATICEALDPATLKQLLDPATYVGLAPEIVESLLDKIRASGWLD
ncbi:adenylosuccinate lyase [Cupriavidus basilensis OR16]|uniref:Adenylosuccinate lyase n=1 Tax=Cupriavidus basilensis OR16 TaxID=1127483 RepID=H1S8S4_9BURK|nr:adenylosuccinate lyase family protein [Cupriavidus basilensis]EHP41116.1 adenylosuccinate lyase [Cupriavidus basilensis OR16]